MVNAVVILCIDDHNNTCHTDISLAYSVDRWWYQEKGLSVLQLTTEIPLYLALCIKSRIEERLATEPNRNWLRVDLYALTSAWIAESFAILDQSWRDHLEKLWEKANKKVCALANPYPDIDTLQKDAELILPYIEGRRWLFEHLEKRLRMIGIRLYGIGSNEQKRRAYLQNLLQYLYLKDEVEITSGVALHKHSGKLHVQCERCGSSGYGIHLHYCSICEHDDLVCDTCYVMGVSKGCSLVISRSKKTDEPTKKYEDPLLQEAGFSYRQNWTGEL